MGLSKKSDADVPADPVRNPALLRALQPENAPKGQTAAVELMKQLRYSNFLLGVLPESTGADGTAVVGADPSYATVSLSDRQRCLVVFTSQAAWRTTLDAPWLQMECNGDLVWALAARVFDGAVLNPHGPDPLYSLDHAMIAEMHQTMQAYEARYGRPKLVKHGVA